MGNWGYDPAFRAYNSIYSWLGPTLYIFFKIMLQTTQLNWSASAISTWNLESHGLGISKNGLPSHWSISTKCFLHGNWELDCCFFPGKFPGMFGTKSHLFKKQLVSRDKQCWNPYNKKIEQSADGSTRVAGFLAADLSFEHTWNKYVVYMKNWHETRICPLNKANRQA